MRQYASSNPISSIGSLHTIYPLSMNSTVQDRRSRNQKMNRMFSRSRFSIKATSFFGLLIAVLAGFYFFVFNGQVASGSTPLETIVVQSGDTLWSLASEHAGKTDPWQWIEETKRINGLTGNDIGVGYHLKVHHN